MHTTSFPRPVLRRLIRPRPTLTAALVAIFLILSAPSLFATPYAVGINGQWDWVNLTNGIAAWGPIAPATSVPVDSNGWPESDFGGTIFDIRKNMPYSGADAYGIDEDFAGTYNVSFTGQATITLSTDGASGGATVQNQTYTAGTNQTTAQFVVQPGHSFVYLTMSSTKRLSGDSPGDGITNLVIIRPGYPAGSTQVYTTNSINAYTQDPYAANRFVLVEATIYYQTYCTATTVCTTYWANRVLPTQALQNITGATTGLPQNNAPTSQSHGVAWEYQIGFANATNTDMWIQIPISADANYVNSLASLILNGDTVNGVTYPGLNSNLHVYVEYSNEVWNSGFPEYTWNYIASQNSGLTPDQQYISTAINFFKIFQSVFGVTGNARGRVRPFLGEQIKTQEGTFQDLQWWEKTNSDLINKYVFGVGDAPYIRPYDTSTVNSTFNSLWSYENNGVNSAYYTNDGSRTDTIAWSSVANYFGIYLVGYESGLSDFSGANMGAVLRDTRISAVLKQLYIQNWAAVGGGLINYFSNQNFVNPFGSYMMVEDYDHALTGSPGPGTTQIRAGFWEAQNGCCPALTAGYLLPLSTTAPVVIDPSQYNISILSTPKPGSQTVWYGTYTPSVPNVYLLRTENTSAATYSVSVYGEATNSAGPIDVYVNDSQIGSIQLPSSPGQSASLTFTAGGGGHYLNSLVFIATSGDDVLPAGTGAIDISLVSGSPVAVVPSAPMNVIGTPGNNSVSLIWAPTTTATAYDVLRSSTIGGPYTQVGSVSTNTYTDSTVTNGSFYYYVITAGNASGQSAYSPQITAFPAPASVPSTPSSVQIKSGADDLGGTAIVSWAAVPNAQGYNVYREVNGGAQTEVAVEQSGTQYYDYGNAELGLTIGDTYSYTVAAVNYAGASPQSSAVTTTLTEQVRQPPTMVSPCPPKAGFAFLKWTADPVTWPQYNTSFNLKRSTTSGGPYTTVVSINTDNAFDFTAVSGTEYYYVVTATNKTGESAPSNQVSCKATVDGSTGYGSGSNNIAVYP